jgi:hypothetical protein
MRSIRFHPCRRLEPPGPLVRNDAAIQDAFSIKSEKYAAGVIGGDSLRNPLLGRFNREPEHGKFFGAEVDPTFRIAFPHQTM